MFKYDLNMFISIKDPMEISGTIIKRYIIFNKDGISKISYDIEAYDSNKTQSKYIILNILEKDILDQHKFNRLNIPFQFKYKIGDIVYTLKNSHKVEHTKGLIIDQRYSESDTKIDYKYRIAIDGEFFIVEEKYLINESEKQLIKTLAEKEESEPIIEPKKIKTDLIISSKKNQKELLDIISYKLNILIEKIDHLDDRITDLEENQIKEKQLIKILEDSEDRIIKYINTIFNNIHKLNIQIITENIEQLKKYLINKLPSNTNINSMIDNTTNLNTQTILDKLNLLLSNSVNQITSESIDNKLEDSEDRIIKTFDTQFKEFKDYINIRLNSIGANRNNY